MSNESGRTDSEGEIPRANPQHVAWLNEGVESWNRRRKESPFTPDLTWLPVGVEIGGPMYPTDDGYLVPGNDFSGVDLSGAVLRESVLSNALFRGANFRSADLTGGAAESSDFSGADFSHAKLQRFIGDFSKFNGAKFGGSVFNQRLGDVFWARWCDFSDTDLSGSDLTGADLIAASFNGTDLTDTNLSHADLVDADLTGAKLSGSRLWRARLFNGLSLGTSPPFGKTVDFSQVHSLRDLIDLRWHLRDVYENSIKRGLVAFYFRGEPCIRFELRPTVMRSTETNKALRPFERDLLTRLKTESPEAFSGCEYAIDELAIARHFGLPSRLLDVTRNPQVGLYWATDQCQLGTSRPPFDGLEAAEPPHESCSGGLHVFAIPTELMCSYESDRVSIVANFARLTILQQERLLTKQREDIEFDHLYGNDTVTDWPRVGMEESMTTLIHYIRREKPYFTSEIDVRDLFRVFVVEPRRSFDRVRAQSGAFMLSAFHERFEGDEVTEDLAGTKLYDHHVLTIPAGAKGEIRDELDWMGINGQTLLADVDSAANAVTDRFRKLAQR